MTVPRPNAPFGHSSWTVRCSTASSSAFARRSGCSSSPPRCRRAPASPSRCCRSCSPRSTRSSAAALVVLAAGGRRRARRGRGGRRGSSARSASRSSRRAASAGAPASSRRRTSSASARARSRCSRAGGLVCASATALAEGVPPRGARARRRSTSRPARSRGSTRSPSTSRSAGYERVERVEERGQFAVRGGLVDVFPTTGREPLRIELFGDEIEQIRAFSPFTQRALRQVDEATIYPGRRARAASSSRSTLGRDEDDEPVASRPTISCRAFDRAPDLVWSARRGARGLGGGGARAGPARRRDACSTPLPQGQPFAFDAQRPALAARGLVRGGERARRPAAPGARRRRRVPAPRRGAAPAAAAAPRAGARSSRPGEAPDGPRVRRHAGAARLRLARARPRAPARHAGLPQAAAARATARRAARCRASPTCAPATTSCTRTTASRSCSASRRRRSPASRATTCCSASAATTASTSRTSRSARSRRYIGADAQAPALSKLGGKAWDNLKNARARAPARDGGRAARSSTRSGRRSPGVAYDVEHEWLERLEAEFPYRETRGPARRDRGGEGRSRGAASDGPARLRRRRLRQDRGRAARRVRRRRQRQAGADARADDGARAAALEHVPRPLPRLPCACRDGLALPQPPKEVEAGACRLPRTARSTC